MTDLKNNSLPTFDEMVSLAPTGVFELLLKCEETPQSPKWHPEGNVLVHTKLVYDRALNTGDVNMVMAALFHDLGKVDTTKLNKKGDWSAHGHEFKSAKVLDKFKDWVVEMGADFDVVRGVVVDHMRVKYMNDMRPHKQQQMRDNPVFDKLVEFTEFDSMKNLTDDELTSKDFTLKQ